MVPTGVGTAGATGATTGATAGAGLGITGAGFTAGLTPTFCVGDGGTVWNPSLLKRIPNGNIFKLATTTSTKTTRPTIKRFVFFIFYIMLLKSFQSIFFFNPILILHINLMSLWNTSFCQIRYSI